ncbi:MAG: hypothetical protein RL557_330 [archaeon]|jgi:hypothetical protein
MKLEEIPQVQLIVFDKEREQEEALVLHQHSYYSSRFVEIQHRSTLHYYVYAHNKFKSHGGVFQRFMRSIENVAVSEGFAVRGGGTIFIEGGKVSLYDFSADYGPYHPQAIKSIVTDFFSQHFPEADVKFG